LILLTQGRILRIILLILMRKLCNTQAIDWPREMLHD